MIILLVILLYQYWYLNPILIAAAFFYVKKKRSFWSTKNVKFSSPGVRQTIVSIKREYYKEFPTERFYGSFRILQPTFIIKDPSLIKQLDFDEHFGGRKTGICTPLDPFWIRKLDEDGRLKGFFGNEIFVPRNLDVLVPLLQESAKSFADFLGKGFSYPEPPPSIKTRILAFKSNILPGILAFIHSKLTKETEKKFRFYVEGSEIKIEDLLSNTFVFFQQGYESLSKLLEYIFYELAMNPDVQNRLRQEIREAKDSSVLDIKYLRMTILEGLRKWPPIATVDREVTEGFKFQDDITLEKGVICVFPIKEIQNDPRYFPEPEKFNPERFSDELNVGAFVPFGFGNRSCPASKLVQTEAQLVVFHVLKEFQVLPKYNLNQNQVSLCFDKKMSS